MKNIFNMSKRRTITEANINVYSVPFTHPKRKMKDHDFIYMLSGEWKIGQNNEVFSLKEDSLLILSANNNHFGLAPCSANTKTMYFHVSSADEDRDCTDEPLCKEDEVCIESLTDASTNQSFKKIFSTIVNSMLEGRQKKASLYFDLLLFELSEKQHLTESESVAEKIKTIIHNNPEKFLSNHALSQMTNVSVKTAENKFKELFGVTIHQYVLKFKIEQAIHYFKYFPDMTIKEISYNLGFYDEYHFSRQFKRIIGISPAIYKKSNCTSSSSR